MLSRKTVFILVLLPISIFSQNHDDWLTPYATIDIENGMVHYKYVKSESYHQAPRFFIPGKFRLSVDPMRIIGPKAYKKHKQQIHDIVQGGNIYHGHATEKLFYLRAFGLLCIWGINEGLPSYSAKGIVEGLCRDQDVEIAETANIMFDLYMSIEKEFNGPYGPPTFFDEGKWLKTGYDNVSGEYLISLKSLPNNGNIEIQVSKAYKKEALLKFEPGLKGKPSTSSGSPLKFIPGVGKLPKGKYRAVLLIDGKEVESVKFTKAK